MPVHRTSGETGLRGLDAPMIQRPEPAPGIVYLVGTPIGHRGDLSPRAKQLLADVDVIACEDTRRSGLLLAEIKARGRRLSFHQHNIKSRLPQLLNLLAAGSSLAVVSDAGLPGISDPGEELAAAARRNGHDVICIPGPCAATTALVSSGLPSGRFCFEGFLPVKGRLRRERLRTISGEQRTTVLYEAPHRLMHLLEELEQLCGGERPLQVARELTKRHEQQIGPTVGDALTHFRQHPPQGECTVVLGGAAPETTEQWSESALLEQLQKRMMEGVSASDAARQVSNETGRSRRELYALLHQQQSD